MKKNEMENSFFLNVAKSTTFATLLFYVALALILTFATSF